MFERELHEGDELTPAVLRLVRRFLDRGLDVVLLSRRNTVRGYVHYGPESRGQPTGLERFAAHIRSFLPEQDHQRVYVSTAHRYKGLEQPATVILDAVVGSYPLVHPAWIFLRVFGDSLESIQSEERRLFYVALTRARESVAIITETNRKSPFLDDIEKHVRLETLDWDSLPAVASLDDPRVEIRVRGAYEVRDQLKDIGFRYKANGKYWRRTYEQAGFELEDLLAQPWASRCFEIAVHGPSGELREAVNP